jgi:hypothetical protein
MAVVASPLNALLPIRNGRTTMTIGSAVFQNAQIEVDYIPTSFSEVDADLTNRFVVPPLGSITTDNTDIINTLTGISGLIKTDNITLTGVITTGNNNTVSYLAGISGIDAGLTGLINQRFPDTAGI